MTINCAIIGLGRSGYNIHYKSLIKKKNFKLLAVCDIDSKKLKLIKNTKNLNKYNDYKKVKNIQNLDLVIISTNSISLFKISKFFLKNKISIVVEKPFCKNINSFDELISLSKKYKSKIFPFFNFRYEKAYTVIKDLLKNKMIGKIYEIKRNETYFNRRDDWQSQKKELGGIINAAAIHQIDQLINLIPYKIKKTFAHTNKIVSKGDADDYLKLIILYHNNLLVDLETSWSNSIPDLKWVILGSKGAIYQNKNNVFVKYFKEKHISLIKRDQFSYNSSEKINWKIKKYNLINNHDINSSQIFYKELLILLKNNKNYKLSLKKSLKTLGFINHYLYEKKR